MINKKFLNYLDIANVLLLTIPFLFLSGCIVLRNSNIEQEKSVVVEQKDLPPPKNGIKVKEYILDWIICGPCPNSDSGTRLSFDYLRGESDVSPSEEEPISDWKWKRFRIIDPLDNNNLNSGDAYGPQTDCVIYAFVYIYSQINQKVSLLIGSDDGIAVWMNGEKVLFNDTVRKMVPDTDVVPITLKLGYNKLLLKISQSTDNYGFCSRFVTKDKKDVENLQVVLTNPGLR